MADAWEYPAPIPDFELIDQNEESFRLGRYKDQHLLVGFVYTRCTLATACPLTMTKMHSVQLAWEEAKKAGKTEGKDLALLTLTLDASHDEPEQLRNYGIAHGVDTGNWTLATGPHDLMNTELPALFNVLAIPDGRGGLNHTVKVALLKPGLLDGAEWTANEFVAAEVIDLVLGS